MRLLRNPPPPLQPMPPECAPPGPANTSVVAIPSITRATGRRSDRPDQCRTTGLRFPASALNCPTTLNSAGRYLPAISSATRLAARPTESASDRPQPQWPDQWALVIRIRPTLAASGTIAGEGSPKLTVICTLWAHAATDRPPTILMADCDVGAPRWMSRAGRWRLSSSDPA